MRRRHLLGRVKQIGISLGNHGHGHNHLVEQIRASGEEPGEYIEVSFNVPERAYGAWPERIRTAFEPARTVRTGRQTFKLTLNTEGV